MKKFLLTLVGCALASSAAFAAEAVYGTTPETAKPFPAAGWYLESLDNAPAEAWFTLKLTNTTPAQWGDCPVASERQMWVYLGAGGNEAFQMMEGDSYVLFPGREYLLKISPKASGFFGMMPAMPLKPTWEGQYNYYPKDITAAQNLTQTQAPGTTAWYLFNSPYPSQITGKFPMTPVPEIEKIEVIHIENPGGTNVGTGLFGPYIKKGLNVIGVTISKEATADISFIFGLEMMTIFNEHSNLLRGQAMAMDVKNTYPDAYYTVDRYFKVPEDGSYKFTNHGAKGTDLVIGKVNLTDPANAYKYVCDWSDKKSAKVGDEDASIVVDNLKKDEILIVRSDAYDVLGGGADNMPYLMVQKYEGSSVDEIAGTASRLSVKANRGSILIESALLADGAEVAVYDMLGRKVAGTSAAGDASIRLNADLGCGVYVVSVAGKNGSESVKVSIR